MIKTWAIVYQNERSKKVGMDRFSASSEAGARNDFNECYRHGNYKILAVVEIPEYETRGGYIAVSCPQPGK